MTEQKQVVKIVPRNIMVGHKNDHYTVIKVIHRTGDCVIARVRMHIDGSLRSLEWDSETVNTPCVPVHEDRQQYLFIVEGQLPQPSGFTESFRAVVQSSDGNAAYDRFLCQHPRAEIDSVLCIAKVEPDVALDDIVCMS